MGYFLIENIEKCDVIAIIAINEGAAVAFMLHCWVNKIGKG